MQIGYTRVCGAVLLFCVFNGNAMQQVGRPSAFNKTLDKEFRKSVGPMESLKECVNESATRTVAVSKKIVLEELKAVQLSRQNQVIAAWLQLKLTGCGEYAVKKLERSEWGLPGKEFTARVTTIVTALKQCDGDESFFVKLYPLVFARVLSEDRLIPGGGNTRSVLLDPVRLEQRLKKLGKSQAPVAGDEER